MVAGWWRGGTNLRPGHVADERAQVRLLCDRAAAAPFERPRARRPGRADRAGPDSPRLLIWPWCAGVVLTRHVEQRGPSSTTPKAAPSGTWPDCRNRFLVSASWAPRGGGGGEGEAGRG